MVFKELSGLRIQLINSGIEYLKDIHEYSVMPEFYEHMEYPPFKSIEDTRAFVMKILDRSDDITGHYWFIYHIDSSKVIGTIGLVDIDMRKGSAELGYGLSALHWGKGFFTEALNLVVDYFFTLPGAHRLFIKTAHKNINSIKSVMKLGFQKEGVLRDYYLDSKTNERWDAVLLSMLKSDKQN